MKDEAKRMEVQVINMLRVKNHLTRGKLLKIAQTNDIKLLKQRKGINLNDKSNSLEYQYSNQDFADLDIYNLSNLIKQCDCFSYPVTIEDNFDENYSNNGYPEICVIVKNTDLKNKISGLKISVKSTIPNTSLLHFFQSQLFKGYNIDPGKSESFCLEADSDITEEITTEKIESNYRYLPPNSKNFYRYGNFDSEAILAKAHLANIEILDWNYLKRLINNIKITF